MKNTCAYLILPLGCLSIIEKPPREITMKSTKKSSKFPRMKINALKNIQTPLLKYFRYSAILIIGFVFGLIYKELLNKETNKTTTTDLGSKASEHKLPQRDYQVATIEKPWMPKPIHLIDRKGYSLAYDARNRNPAWVYEDLTSDKLQGNADRENSAFKEDSIIPAIFRAKLNDYKGSGFDRGHMAPAADHKSNLDAMNDTFFMSNMCPQCPQLNRGFWAKLEKHARDLTKSYAHVYVITGPLYLPRDDKDGKRYVKYQVIGSNDIAVPTHFFKVLRLEKSSGSTDTQAFLVPNEPITTNTAIDSFKVNLDKIERVAGSIFSSK
jgi:endonuclease G, mitochondrial